MDFFSGKQKNSKQVIKSFGNFFFTLVIVIETNKAAIVNLSSFTDTFSETFKESTISVFIGIGFDAKDNCAVLRSKRIFMRIFNLFNSCQKMSRLT